jgi:hypothetical protein
MELITIGLPSNSIDEGVPCHFLATLQLCKNTVAFRIDSDLPTFSPSQRVTAQVVEIFGAGQTVCAIVSARLRYRREAIPMGPGGED